MAILVGAVRHDEMGIGEGLVKHIPVETSLGVFLQLLLQFADLFSVPVGPSVQFFTVLRFAGAAEEPVGIRQHRLRMAKPMPFALIVTAAFTNE
jgi:hypothetical protein